MCAGAIAHSRIARVVYGAKDPKGGAVENGVRFLSDKSCHAKVSTQGGVLEEQCSQILKSFFKARR